MELRKVQHLEIPPNRHHLERRLLYRFKPQVLHSRQLKFQNNLACLFHKCQGKLLSRQLQFQRRLNNLACPFLLCPDNHHNKQQLGQAIRISAFPLLLLWVDNSQGSSLRLNLLRSQGILVSLFQAWQGNNLRCHRLIKVFLFPECLNNSQGTRTLSNSQKLRILAFPLLLPRWADSNLICRILKDNLPRPRK